MRLVLLLLLFVVSLIFSASSAAVFAHGTGASLEAITDGYRIDVGYEPEDVRAGGTTVFDFALFDEDTGESAAFESVWTRISASGGNAAFLATGVARPSFGPTTLLYRFSEAGTYDISVRFNDADGEPFAEETFSFVVNEDEQRGTQSSSALFPVLGALLVGAFLGALVMRFVPRT